MCKSAFVIRFLLFGIMLIFTRCNNEVVNNVGAANLPYESVNLYCRCFRSDSIVTISTCTSPFTVRARDIVDSLDFYKLSSDQNKISQIRRLLFDRKLSSEAINYTEDSRFAILLSRNKLEGDTFVFRGNDQFIYNEKYLYKYNFDVMDSLRRILQYDKINCEPGYP